METLKGNSKATCLAMGPGPQVVSCLLPWAVLGQIDNLPVGFVSLPREKGGLCPIQLWFPAGASSGPVMNDPSVEERAHEPGSPGSWAVLSPVSHRLQDAGL